MGVDQPDHDLYPTFFTHSHRQTGLLSVEPGKRPQGTFQARCCGWGDTVLVLCASGCVQVSGESAGLVWLRAAPAPGADFPL